MLCEKPANFTTTLHPVDDFLQTDLDGWHRGRSALDVPDSIVVIPELIGIFPGHDEGDPPTFTG